MSNFNELAKILTHEQSKGLQNSSVIGGLEPFVEKWAQRTRNDENAVTVQQILDALAGYAQADATQRNLMIQRAVTIARQADAFTKPTRSPATETASRTPRTSTPQREDLSRPPSEKKSSQPRVEHREELTAPPELEPIPEEDEELDEEPAYVAPTRMDFGLDADVSRLQGVGKVKAAQLERLGVTTVRDLLYHFPRAYRPVKRISELMYGDDATVICQVSHINSYQTRNGFHITDVVLMDPTGGITAKFFKQPWVAKSLRPRQFIVVSGKVDRDLNKLSFKSPEYEPLTKELQRLLDAARVYPVYPLTEGVKANWLRKTERGVVGFWADKVVDPLPSSLRARANLMPLSTALREIHFPSSMETMAAARHRFAFEELLYIQLGVFRQRRKWRQ